MFDEWNVEEERIKIQIWLCRNGVASRQSGAKTSKHANIVANWIILYVFITKQIIKIRMLQKTPKIRKWLHIRNVTWSAFGGDV